MQTSLLSFAAPSGPGYAARRQRRLLREPQPTDLARAVARRDADAQPASFAGLIRAPERRPLTVAGLVLLALAAHVAVVVLTHRAAPPETNAPTPPIALEIAPPPPPPPPAIREPPKPLPEAHKPPPAAHRPPVVRPRPAPAPHETPPPAQAIAPAPAPVAKPSAEAIPAPPAPPAPAAPPVERVTEAHGRAGYLHNPPPVYPDAAAERNWQGRVMLRVHVLADGHPDDVRVAQSSGHQVLDDAAVRTVSHWMFAPATRGDVPVDGWANVPIDFKLGN